MKKLYRGLALVLVCLLTIMSLAVGCTNSDSKTEKTEVKHTAEDKEESSEKEQETEESAGADQAEEKEEDQEKADPSEKIALVLGVGGLGDQGYNDLIYAGAERAKEELGIEFDYAEPKQISEFELIFRDMAGSGEYAVIIGVGFDQVDPLTKVAEEFPEQNFAIIDGNIEAANVASYTNKEEEGSFLVGALAGLMVKNADNYDLKDKTQIGFIGAMEIPFLVKFYAGYMAGAKYVNPDVETVAGYVGGDNPFGDTSTAKEIALSQNNKGAGIIYHAAGGSGLGMFQAAAEADFIAIGCNSNQNIIDPDYIVASMLKRVDTASFEIIKASVVDKNLSVGEQTVLGVKEEGIGYTLDGSNIEVSKDIVESLSKIEKQIMDGKFVVPTTLEEVEDFLKKHSFK